MSHCCPMFWLWKINIGTGVPKEGASLFLYDSDVCRLSTNPIFRLSSFGKGEGPSAPHPSFQNMDVDFINITFTFIFWFKIIARSRI